MQPLGACAAGEGELQGIRKQGRCSQGVGRLSASCWVAQAGALAAQICRELSMPPSRGPPAIRPLDCLCAGRRADRVLALRAPSRLNAVEVTLEIHDAGQSTCRETGHQAWCSSTSVQRGYCHCRVLELAQKELQKAVQGVEDKERRAVAAQTAAAQVPSKFVTRRPNLTAVSCCHTAPTNTDRVVVDICTEKGRRGQGTRDPEAAAEG